MPSRPSDADVEAVVEQALHVAQHAIDSCTPVVRQAIYQLLNTAGCRVPRDPRSVLRVLARHQLEGSG